MRVVEFVVIQRSEWFGLRLLLEMSMAGRVVSVEIRSWFGLILEQFWIIQITEGLGSGQLGDFVKMLLGILKRSPNH